uniref:Uncharacterized protein n=1 Tax=Amphimedon queenslandica TaxID=400682 RepID=A0A1X7TWF7_AMPQE
SEISSNEFISEISNNNNNNNLY